jgi:hypothetical protein
MVTLVTSVSSYWTAYELDRAGRSPRTLAFVLGVLFCAPGMLWLIIQSRWHERPAVEAAIATTRGDEELLEGRVG